MSDDPETGHLTASNKESGKAVYGAEDKKIGKIESVMIDKTSGEIAYAVLSFGGFLGIGKDHFPVPWKLLRFDPELGAYRSDISENRLHGAPKHGTETVFDWNARYAELDDYYNEEVLSADKHWFGKVGEAAASIFKGHKSEG
ncbi:PRC-barrel protein [Nitrobacter sp. Nb-311A]|uniref:PRC-barrel domain-containing protein n=1 Tax=Nitrobacter sp. Nb-311A TaxID=314253 RepID=UPI000068664D|nr:PRC-barrel protein [Nitrobacter sp. Nb-311A]MCB1392451.1 PRC-barrel domain-containing protein [Nitrobacter sp.]MCV0385400.1 PRC-barrel domain-containing protein [Nitrobacter sp.]